MHTKWKAVTRMLLLSAFSVNWILQVKATSPPASQQTDLSALVSLPASVILPSRLCCPVRGDISNRCVFMWEKLHINSQVAYSDNSYSRRGAYTSKTHENSSDVSLKVTWVILIEFSSSVTEQCVDQSDVGSQTHTHTQSRVLLCARNHRNAPLSFFGAINASYESVS